MAAIDSLADTAANCATPPPSARWNGGGPLWLTMTALLGLAAFFLLASWLAASPQLGGHWRVGAAGGIELAAGARLTPQALQSQAGKTLVAIGRGESRLDLPDALALQRSPRWIIDDAERERHLKLHADIAALIAQGSPQLHFSDTTRADAPLVRPGFDGLGGLFWLLAAIALMLYLAAVAMLLGGPSPRSLLYALMAMSQAGNLVFIAAASTSSLAMPQPLANWDASARMAFDFITATAAVHLCSLCAPHLQRFRLAPSFAWACSGVLIALQVSGHLPHAWWWTQLSLLALCGWSLAILRAAYRAQPHPDVLQLQRFGVIGVSAWTLLTLWLAMTGGAASAPNPAADMAATIWTVFLASLLLLVPFFARSQPILRELSLLAAICAFAASLNLLFDVVMSFGQLASLTLSLLIALGVYAGARQWLVNQLLSRNMLTTERMFEQLYRSAREVEAHPERATGLLMTLLRECFEPMGAELGSDDLQEARVADQGASLIVPVSSVSGEASGARASGSIRLSHAHHGRRPFSIDDARLANRIVEQLRRAVAFDRAVEQGRSEERSRIAQDLHDDIGARLLTLMYKAQSPEMEEYLRHTLKDLKTLTRGLAKGSHRLSHAAGEWKADITHRLTAADLELGWSFSADRDIALNVVQWSALTRILRELVSNTIAHAAARRVDVALQLEGNRLELSVSDDGNGHDPERWSHGLGLGGVRKRVKQLGGDVEWHEVEPVGIYCQVRIPTFGGDA